MKAESTIKREIRTLAAIAEYNGKFPDQTRREAYEAYHALRWAIGGLDERPSKLILRAAQL